MEFELNKPFRIETPALHFCQMKYPQSSLDSRQPLYGFSASLSLDPTCISHKLPSRPTRLDSEPLLMFRSTKPFPIYGLTPAMVRDCEAMNFPVDRLFMLQPATIIGTAFENLRNGVLRTLLAPLAVKINAPLRIPSFDEIEEYNVRFGG